MKVLDLLRDVKPVPADSPQCVSVNTEAWTKVLAEVDRLTAREESLLGYNSQAVQERQDWRIRAEASESLRHDLERRHVQLLALVDAPGPARSGMPTACQAGTCDCTAHLELVPPRHKRDRCELCRGTKGGEPGNENVQHGGTIVCDDCDVIVGQILKAAENKLVAARPQFMQQLREKADRLEKAIRWALGETGAFPPMPRKLEGKPRRNYWWRTELRKRAGL